MRDERTPKDICGAGRLAYKPSSNFFTNAKRERLIFYGFCGKSERESHGTGNEKRRTSRMSTSPRDDKPTEPTKGHARAY